MGALSSYGDRLAVLAVYLREGAVALEELEEEVDEDEGVCVECIGYV